MSQPLLYKSYDQKIEELNLLIIVNVVVARELLIF